MKANLVVEDTRDIPNNKTEISGKVQNQTIQITLMPLFEIAVIYNFNRFTKSRLNISKCKKYY